MATLVELRNAGSLVDIDPLESHELPWRTLYATPDFINWLDVTLPLLPHKPEYSAMTPQEQVFASFADFASGAAFSDDRRFKKLSASPDNFVWEIKSEEVRVFGWVPEKNVFVCCFGDSKDNIVVNNSYGLHIARTVFMRTNLDLNEPKYVESKEYRDVLSNKT